MPDVTRRATVAGACALPVALAAPGLLRAQTTAANADRPLFGASFWRLPNGLAVAHVEQRRAPVVAQYLFVAAGGGEDPPGRSGVAHFLEHMMFKGSPRVASGEFSRRVAREGGTDNAFTSRDVTAYHQTVEASRLPMIAMMQADSLAAPALPEAEVEPERLVVIEERNQRTDSSPRARFREALDAAFWGPQHWAGRPIIGWPDEIRAISRDDLLAFHARHYRPANCALVVAGAVSADTVRAVVEQEYGGIPPGPPLQPGPLRGRAAPPPAPGQRRHVQQERGIRDAAFSRFWAAPTATWGDREHADPLEVLAHLLGGGQGSRLFRALVESGLAVSAGASYDSDSLGIGEFAIYAAPRREVVPARLEGAVQAELERLLQEGVSAAEVARSIRQLTAGALLSLDGLGAAPRLLGGALALGLPLAHVEFWPARIRAVTPAQVDAAARAVLGGQFSIAGWLLPEGVEAPA
jgi:zinc protease